jgi:hypothetical protein
MRNRKTITDRDSTARGTPNKPGTPIRSILKEVREMIFNELAYRQHLPQTLAALLTCFW